MNNMTKQQWVNEVLRNQWPKRETRHICLVLSGFMDEDGECNPLPKEIFKLSKLTATCTEHHLNKAVKLGWLTRTPKGGTKQYTYQAILPEG